MQIFIRFAYGKVITIDISRRTTKIKDLKDEIRRRFKIPKLFAFRLTLKRKDTPNMELKEEDEVVCKDDRIKKNDVIEFIETNEKKFKEVRVRYQERKAEEGAVNVEWKDSVLPTDLNPNSMVSDVKANIKLITKLEPLKQRLFYGNRELDNENATLKSYGMDIYEVLEHYYKDDKEKKQELDEINKLVIFCIERMVDIYTVNMAEYSKQEQKTPKFIDSSMKVLLLKKIAINFKPINLCPEGSVEIEEANIGDKIVMYIEAEEIKDNKLTVQELVTQGKIKKTPNSNIYFKKN